MGSKTSSILGALAPIALSIAFPGVGTAIGGALGASGLGASALGSGIIGAGSGLLSGGGLKGALLGGAGGAVGAGGLGSSLGESLGLSGSTASALGSGLGGAISGSAGGLKNALLGGLGGAAGGAIQGGALDGVLGGSGQSAGENALVNAAKSNVGLTGGSTGGSLSSYLTPASTIFGGINSTLANNDMQKQLLEAQGKSAAALAPYTAAGATANQALSDRLAAGFDPGDLASNPGYQFTQQQGEQALNRSLGAQGNLFSGAALKAASDYNTGLANQTYEQRYNDWLQQNQQLAGQAGTGLTATNAGNTVNDNIGNINANNTLAGSNIVNNTLSSLLKGSGATTYSANGTPNTNPLFANLSDAQKKALGLS